MLIHPWDLEHNIIQVINDQIPPRYRFNYNVTTKNEILFLNNLKKTFKM